MKVFIVGMPQSGRTTVAKAISQLDNNKYVDACSWIKSSFRIKSSGEHLQQYNDEYHSWLTNRLTLDPSMISDNIRDSISGYGKDAENKYTFIIDGIFSPKDFVQLFDYNKDMVVFLNRTNNESEFKDYENIGISVMRDFCFWLASAELLSKNRWLEYNFTIPGEDSNLVKTLGHKNSVFIIKSIDKVTDHLTNFLTKNS